VEGVSHTQTHQHNTTTPCPLCLFTYLNKKNPKEFDANADGRLEASELRRLCDLVGRSLSDGELKEAVRLLGSRDAGYVYFNDFAGARIEKG
jgi:hypothetical protein